MAASNRAIVWIGGVQTRAIEAAERAFEGGNNVDAFKYYNAEANHPNPDPRALRMLGQFYQYGYKNSQNQQIVAINLSTALDYYQRAYALGDARAEICIRTLNIQPQPAPRPR